MNSIVLVSRSVNYLAHHGIKGQKWGVKNGPPYPLKDTSHTTSEKKVGMIPGLTEAAIYMTAAIAMYGLAYLSSKKADARRTAQYEEEYYQKRKIKSLSEAPKVDPSSMTMDEHMKEVNPDYPDLGSTDNCMFCTTAMAMRMKGYDVTAEKCPDGWSFNNLKDTFKDCELETPKCRSIKQLEKHLKDQGDGAYGNFIVYWSVGGGHSMFYHVDNGEVKIYDTQANKVRQMRDFNGVILTSSSEIVRLDNKEPTEKVLGAVKRREEKKA